MAFSTRAARPVAMLLAGSVLTPMLAFGAAGCGNNGGGANNGSGGSGATTVATTPAPMASNAPAPGSGAPMMAGGNAMQTQTAQPQQRPGMSTKEKVVILAGAALLFYLYKKHQAEQQNMAAAQTGGANGASPQLYQSKNGGIYYRNAQHQPVWVTAPSGGVAVPQNQVSQYLPNYQQYNNQPAPAAPAGAQTQSATQYDPQLSNS